MCVSMECVYLPCTHVEVRFQSVPATSGWLDHRHPETLPSLLPSSKWLGWYYREMAQWLKALTLAEDLGPQMVAQEHSHNSSAKVSDSIHWHRYVQGAWTHKQAKIPNKLYT